MNLAEAKEYAKKNIHNRPQTTGRLAGKIAVVTGGAQGFGLGIATEMYQEGASVVLADLNDAQAKEAAKGLGERAIGLKVDVSDAASMEEMVCAAVEHFGGIDVMICNAGISMRALFDDVDLDVLHRLMDVNFWGTVYCTKYALPYLQKSHGSLVGISSVAGIHGLPGRTGYSASKFAMTGFLETIRIENLKKGVHVMVACPGFTASNVRFSALTANGSQQGATPRKEEKMMTAEQVARIVARGIARRKRLCLMEIEGRATHFVKKFAPGLVDRLFYYVMSKEPDSPFK